MHINERPGKHFRSQLIATFNRFYQLNDSVIEVISQLVEILHNSSLMIDDIEDNSSLRRGVPTSHLVFGIPRTLNSANYMYFEAMEMLLLLSPTEPAVTNRLLHIFIDELKNLHKGQGLDIYWRDIQDFAGLPREDMYFNMVMNKTGGLFRLTIRIMELLSPIWQSKISLVPLSNLLGIIYQVRDDYLNLVDSELITNKGFAEDLSEGKLSFPILHGLSYALSSGDDLSLKYIDIIKLKTTDYELKRQAVDYLKKISKSMDYTKNTLLRIASIAREGEYMPRSDGNPDIALAREELEQIIERLCTID